MLTTALNGSIKSQTFKLNQKICDTSKHILNHYSFTDTGQHSLSCHTTEWSPPGLQQANTCTHLGGGVRLSTASLRLLIGQSCWFSHGVHLILKKKRHTIKFVFNADYCGLKIFETAVVFHVLAK